MGRGRVELKRIENKISRQVSFSKRRSGLMKKANEISVMCDAEVALIVFSNKGKLSHFSSHSSMERIIQKHERYSSAQKNMDTLQPKDDWYVDNRKLLARIDVLERNLRNYEGEDLEGLSLRELQSLQQQVDAGLKRIRRNKNKLMLEAISQLHKKEKSLQEDNHLLAKKLKDQGVKEEDQQLHTRNSCETMWNFGSKATEFGAPPERYNGVIPSWLLPRPSH